MRYLLILLVVIVLFWVTVGSLAKAMPAELNWLQLWMEYFLASLQSVLSVLWDNALAISLGLIFLSALVGFWTRTKTVDHCLKDFMGYPGLLELKNGYKIQGKMHIYSTGIELVYSSSQESELDGQSYICYKSEYPNIATLQRLVTTLAPEQHKKRNQELYRTQHPSLGWKMHRGFCNLLGMFRDAFVQSIAMILGQAKKNIVVAPLITQHEKNIATLGNELIGYAGNAYDPILEKYLGCAVVLEVTKGEQREKYAGIFKEYSSDFLEILNIVQNDNVVDWIVPRSHAVIRHAGTIKK